MLKVLVPAVGLLGLFTVAARPVEAPLSVQQPDPAPMGWHLYHEGPMAKLAYGVANSDQLAMMLTCTPGDREAVVYGDVQPDTPRLQRVGAGPVEADPLSGGVAFETRVPLRDPVLMQLANDGRMPVESQSGGHRLRADAAERRLVSAFIAYCGADAV